jgi:hypothetical protein
LQKKAAGIFSLFLVKPYIEQRVNEMFVKIAN